MVGSKRRFACVLALVAATGWSQDVTVDGRFTGSWFDPERSGEGWVLQILDDGTSFVAWFTYPPAAKGTSGQAWLVGSGMVDGDRVSFENLQQFSGPMFGPQFDPDALVAADWGTLEFSFGDCDSGSLSYAGPAEFGAAERSVVRLTGIADAPCTQPARKGVELRPVSSAWFDPSHNGEGWFLEELGDGRVNLYWFTYDENGNPAWLTGVGERTGDRIVFSDVFLVTGPAFGEDFDPDAVTLTPWGTVIFDLLECNLARLEYESLLPGFGAGALDPVRLTLLDGVDCQDFPSAPLTAGIWREIAPSPTPRSEVTAAVLDGIVYLSGGFGGPNVLESYDLTTDQWTAHPNMPEGKNHHMAVAHEGEIYVFGGYADSSFSLTASVFVYNPVTRQWRRLSDMSQPKAAANVALSLGDHVYLIGGTGFVPQRYDPATDSYTFLPRPADNARDHSSSVVFGNELWLLGGRSNQTGATVTVEVFDPVAETWRGAPNMTMQRSGFGAAVVQGQIMAVGGEVLSAGQGLTLDSFEVFAPSRNAFVRGPDLPIALHGIVAVEVDDRLLVLGGSRQAGQVNAAGRYFLYEPAPATGSR